MRLAGSSDELEAHRKVDGLDMFGDRADGDVVDAGQGDVANRGESYAARRFEPGFGAARAIAFHRGAHVVECEFVEQDDVGTRDERLVEFVNVSTSTSTGIPGEVRRAVAMAVAMEPAAMMWFSLMSTMSYNPRR